MKNLEVRSVKYDKKCIVVIKKLLKGLQSDIDMINQQLYDFISIINNNLCKLCHLIGLSCYFNFSLLNSLFLKLFRRDLLKYMISQGYKHIGTIGIDDILIKPDKVKIKSINRNIQIYHLLLEKELNYCRKL